jgi:hypothetical protein
MNNLVLNGSFETGDWTNWTGTGPTDEENSIRVNGINDLNYAYFGNLYGNLITSQIINTEFGKNYVLSYYLKNRSSTVAGVQYFAASLDGGNTVIPGSVINENGLNSGTEWTLYSFNFTATGPINLSFITQNYPSYFSLTAITITITSEIPSKIVKNKCSLFSNNSMVFYKPNSLSSGSGSSGVRNSRCKQRRT